MKKDFLLIVILLIAYKANAFNYLPTTKDGKVIKHKYYSLSYVEKHELAEWTAHKLTRESVNGNQRRTDDFRNDPFVSTGSATTADYKGSGYDRGHLVPAGDMKLNRVSMSQTFYMSNMAPQTASMNRGVWRRLESEIRDWTEEQPTLYIITGPVLDRIHETIGPNKVSVPNYFYKIVLDYSSKSPKMIAFLVPNHGTKRWIDDFVVSVDYLEDITGIDFFPALPDHIEEDLERRSSPWKWGIY